MRLLRTRIRGGFKGLNLVGHKQFKRILSSNNRCVAPPVLIDTIDLTESGSEFTLLYWVTSLMLRVALNDE